MRQYIPAVRSVQLLLDLAVVQACFYLLTFRKLEGNFPAHYQALALISVLLMIVVYQWDRVYHHFRAGGFWREAKALLKAWGTVLLVLLLLGFATKTNIMFSREVLFTWAMVAALAQLAVHSGTGFIVRMLRAHGVNVRRTLLVGDGQLAYEFSQHLARDPHLGIEVLGFVTTGQDSTGNPQAASLRCLGPVEQLPEVIRTSQPDLVYITLPLEQSSRIEELSDALLPLHMDVHWVPDISALKLLNHGVYEVEGRPVIRLSDSSFVGLRRAAKWLEDMILATIILAAVSPLMLAIAISIKISSPGPVLFKQRRIGHNGKTIITYKFRSMVLHQEPPGHLTQAVREDPRVTPRGAFLRRNSFDELPQFINVLQGRMSIVGPRPHAEEHDFHFARDIRAYMLRHRVKPGITGWAQVNGWRGETDTPDKIQMRVKYDLHYINNWSLSFDLLIIARTLWQMLTGKNAY